MYASTYKNILLDHVEKFCDYLEGASFFVMIRKIRSHRDSRHTSIITVALLKRLKVVIPKIFKRSLLLTMLNRDKRARYLSSMKSILIQAKTRKYQVLRESFFANKLRKCAGIVIRIII